MNEYNPDMWIMKITPGNPGSTRQYFENLFVKEGCKNLIGYTKEEGQIDEFLQRWNAIKIGDLVVVVEGYNRVHGVVEITSDPFDDVNNEGDNKSDWFYHRRRAKLVKHFNPAITAKANTNRDTIIQYSGDGAIAICDEVWDKIKDEYIQEKNRKEMEEKLKVLRYKKQVILQGPPGTGKTRLAKLMANELIKAEKTLTPLEYVEWYIQNYKLTKENQEKISQRRQLLNEFVDLFPKDQMQDLTLDTYCSGNGSKTSFCYWIEKKLRTLGRFSPGPAGNDVYLVYYKPELKGYKVKNNIPPDDMLANIKIALQELVVDDNNVRARRMFRESLVLRILNAYFPDKYFPVFNSNHLQLIAKILGIPFNVNDVIQLNISVNKRFQELKTKHNSPIENFDLMWQLYHKFNIKGDDHSIEDVKEISELGEKKLIQFHPAYTYEDFVRGIVAEANNEGQIEYKVVNKVLADFAQKALDNENINYVLIIDEINRANLPSVLGELIYALEYRYDRNKPSETEVDSIYSLKNELAEDIRDNKLRLPGNLFIIGTMNTADRSVGHIDYAIKRRFAFIDVLPTDSVIDEVISDSNVRTKAKELYKDVAILFNEEVTGDKSRYLQSDFKSKDVQLGHSYFLADTMEDLEMKLRYEIKPLLYEYLKDGVLSSEAEVEIEKLKLNV
jgi:5-methylcytosine-specific restriction enzyme B